MDMAQTRSLKEEQADLGSHWGCWWQQESQQKNPKGKGTQRLPTWRFEDLNLSEFDALRRDGGFAFVALPMNFWISPHCEEGAHLRRSE